MDEHPDHRIAAGRPLRILQISPNDHPPFKDICEVYAAAGASLGCRVDTVYLSAPRDEPAAATYLDMDDLQATASIAQRLRAHVEQDGIPMLAICHRYRTYRVLRRTGLQIPRVVAVAHEFGFFKRLQRRIERRLFARDVLFAGVSPAVQAELSKTVAGALCLPNGIDIERFDKNLLSREQAQKALGIKSAPFTIGVLGRLVSKKQPELAIAAFRLFLERVPGARLLVIGDGELRSSLEASAGDLPVQFCGFVADAKRTLRALDVLLLVSKDIEAFGMVALEAMVAGVPVVAGPSAGPRSVLGEVGYCYDVAQPQAIAAALHGVWMATTVADSGQNMRTRQGVERARQSFSIAAIARRLDDVFFRVTRTQSAEPDQ